MISRGYHIKCWLLSLFLLKVEEPFSSQALEGYRRWGREGKKDGHGNGKRIGQKVYESQHTRDR